ITIKSGTNGLSRKEFEYEIPIEDAEELLTLCVKIIVKKRFEIVFKGFKWEVDEFHQPHKGLLLAEIELPTEDTSFHLPDWVGEEVTGKPEYYNANMLKE